MLCEYLLVHLTLIVTFVLLSRRNDSTSPASMWIPWGTSYEVTILEKWNTETTCAKLNR